MYLEHYNLAEPPFALSCDPRFFFAGPGHNEALASCLYAVQQRKGMVLITGRVGAGKTLVSRSLARRLGPAVQTVVLKHPPRTAKSLLRALAEGVGLSLGSADAHSLQSELQMHLQRLCRRGRLVCLVVDEAQDLPASALEEIRLLWNWESQSRRLLQIVLIGQPELRALLGRPRWESLRQRIVLSFHLTGLEPDDVPGYIQHRIELAGQGGARLEFTPHAVEQIARAAENLPRLINVLCDNCLLVGYSQKTHTIDEKIVQAVLDEMNCWGLDPVGRGEANDLTPCIPGESRG